VPRQTLIHVHGGAEELGRVFRPALPINSGMANFVEALTKLSFGGWKDQVAAARQEFIEWTEPRKIPGEVQYGEIIRWLSDHLPEDTIIAGGAGNFAAWLHRHFRYKGFRTQLGPTNGSMGYGYPAAVAAKIAEPKRPVLALCGDGDFLMTGQEIATAAQYGANFVALVVNNGLYGTIRMHQEREYPGRVYATELRNPDFAAYARAFGGHGETVTRTADFAPAYERAVASSKPALIEVKIDPDAISPSTTLSAIREKARKAQSG
jgi:acetolactate synthase I/II/III large subunit